MDTSRIESRFLLENQYLGLGFPAQGYIFFKCTGIEEVFYEYNESPASVAADTQEDASRLGMAAFKIDNILRVEKCEHLYQVFMGWKPGAVRRYLYYPFETSRGNLDVKAIYTKSPFGYIDGFESPYDRPSKETEMFIPKDVDVAFAWWNPLSEAVTVEEHLLIRRMDVEIIRDADLIDRIMKGQQPCRIKTIGGIGSSFDYKARSILDVDFVKLGASRSEIDTSVKEG